eukprot:4711462-Pyramimonas_sp.AAC.1
MSVETHFAAFIVRSLSTDSSKVDGPSVLIVLSVSTDCWEAVGISWLAYLSPPGILKHPSGTIRLKKLLVSSSAPAAEARALPDGIDHRRAGTPARYQT